MLVLFLAYVKFENLMTFRCTLVSICDMASETTTTQ